MPCGCEKKFIIGVGKLAARKVTLRELLKNCYPNLPDKDLFSLVLGGRILVDGERVRAPNVRVKPGAKIELVPKKRFLSRGGEKLAPVLELWRTEVRGKTFIDAGCSKGGFTDCLLQYGANTVHAVDVGYNQLDYRIRGDARVKIHERTNIMKVQGSDFCPAADAAVMDLSFRSVRGACAHVLSMLEEKWLIALVKPQFEWNDPGPDFNGIVSDQKMCKNILIDLIEALWAEKSFVSRIEASPVKGRKGNQEFFFLVKSVAEQPISSLLDYVSGLTLE